LKRFLFILAVLGYVVFLAMALLPALTPLRPVGAYGGMAVCALVAIVCSSGGQRSLAVLGLVFALAGGIHAWRNNNRVYARMREMNRVSNQRLHDLDVPQPTNTNR
jgi:hypothetical protein